MKAVKQSGTCSTFWFLGLFSFPGFDCFSFNQGMERITDKFSIFWKIAGYPPLLLIAIHLLCFSFKTSVGLGKVQTHQPKTECWLPRGPHRIFLGKNPGMVNGKRTI